MTEQRLRHTYFVEASSKNLAIQEVMNEEKQPSRTETMDMGELILDVKEAK